jgi:septin 7
MSVAVLKQPEAYVGFSQLPDQVHRRSTRAGFHFNLMVVGELLA